jgi:hypothetical protein
MGVFRSMRHLFEKKDVVAPSGTNSDTARRSFLEKWFYDQLFPNFQGAPPGVLRANMKGMYGKVDKNGFAVLPKSEEIIQIESDESDGETFRCLSITEECFSEMVTYYENLKIRGKVITEGTSFESLAPKRAMTFIKEEYRSYYVDLMKSFFASVANSEYSAEPIGDYFTFERAYISYVNSLVSQGLPFTFSEFCLSFQGSPHQSGLVIDLSDEDCSEDEAKFKGFLTDPNFNLVKSVANRFGFRVDKHIPWRLYLDLNSPYITEKLRKRGVKDLSEFFNRYYNKVSPTEIEGIPSRLLSAYNNLVNYSSTYSQVVPCKVEGKKTLVRKRKKITLEQVNESTAGSHWIRVYAFMRSIELKKRWTQREFDRLVEETYNISEYRDERHAHRFLESHFTDRTSELFIEKPLTKDNIFDNIVEKDSRKAHFKF